MAREDLALLAALLALVASLATVAVVVLNGRADRFASERWWERKASAYAELFEVLTRLRAQLPLIDGAAAATGRRVADEGPVSMAALADLALELRLTLARHSLMMSVPVVECIEQARYAIVHILEEAGRADERGSLRRRIPVLVDEAMEKLRLAVYRDLRLMPGA